MVGWGAIRWVRTVVYEAKAWPCKFPLLVFNIIIRLKTSTLVKQVYYRFHFALIFALIVAKAALTVEANFVLIFPDFLQF